jgi:uncharacterized sporulation protein YeaH/YhbH (DUF444 family)
VGQKIERDHQRFRKIVRGKVKSNLAKYISRGEMIGKKGKDLVSIPVPSIDIPQFRYGQKNSARAGPGRATATSASRSARHRGTPRAAPATSRAATSSRSI